MNAILQCMKQSAELNSAMMNMSADDIVLATTKAMISLTICSTFATIFVIKMPLDMSFRERRKKKKQNKLN